MDFSQVKQKLFRRYAVKKFVSWKKIADEKLVSILDAARLAPSSMWLQPRKFFVVENQEKRKELLQHSYNQEKVVEAWHLIVVAAKNDIEESYIDDFLHDTAKTRWQDMSSLEWLKNMITWRKKDKSKQEIKARCQRQTYIALWFLLYTAAILEVDACPMEWFVAEKYDEILDLQTQWYHAIALVTIWYRSPDDKYADLEKVRFDFDQKIPFIS